MRENILLINPAINPESQSMIVNQMINKIFPTSIGILAAYLMDRGQVGSVRIIDEQIEFIKEQDIEKIILSLDSPRIIGFSVLTLNSKRAYDLAREIKRVDPDALIVLGGIHPTVLTDEALSCKNVDIVIRGEGEETFKELVELVLDEKDYKRISGTSTRENGNILHNPDRALIANLDDIPPFPYHLFEKDLDKYPSFGAVFTSRGCPHKCIFCSSRNISGIRYRVHSIERIVSEIKILVEKYNQKIIWLMDDNIAVNPKRFKNFVEMIIAEDLHKKTEFHGSMRGDNLTDEVLEWAKKGNFRMIAFGMETGTEPLMKLIDKRETVEAVVSAIKRTHQKGIATAATLIFGLPTETRKDRWETMRLVRSLPLASVRFNTLCPYPGTPAFAQLHSEGKVLIKEDWANFAVQYMWEGDGIPYVPDGNNRYELIFDTMFANLSFYLSFSGIMKLVKSNFAGGNVVKLSERWYFSPKTMWRLTMLFLYLSRRFSMVTLKMITKQER
jgi:radical SAM superfamily enzyme YgiQ (UPF0313 family)